MKKALFVTLLCLSSMTFADTIKKNDSVICRKTNGDSYIGPASKLFKDGSVEIQTPATVDNLGVITATEFGSVRIDAKKCKVQNFVEESEDISKEVVCSAFIDFETLGVTKILGTVQAEFQNGKYIIMANGYVSPDGEYQASRSSILIDKNKCSIDETVDELNVNNISRAPGKEVSEIETHFSRKINKASKQ